jgi:hypothetical protein
MIPFRLEHGHIVASIDGRRWLVDTGSPWTFGEPETVTICGEPREVSGSPLALSIVEIADEIASLAGPDASPFRLDGLLGCDSLAGLTLEIRWDREELVLGGLPSSGRPNPVAAIPTCEVRVGCRTAPAVIDTGAWCTYVAPDLVEGLPRTGKRQDFLPSAGRFEADTVDVDVSYDGVSGRLTVSVAPPLLAILLDKFGAWVILGNDVMSRAAVTRVVIPG